MQTNRRGLGQWQLRASPQPSRGVGARCGDGAEHLDRRCSGRDDPEYHVLEVVVAPGTGLLAEHPICQQLT